MTTLALAVAPSRARSNRIAYQLVLALLGSWLIAGLAQLSIPLPFTPIGTMGAVISMEGMRANRKQIFDIGLAGPLAGLVVAVPIL